MHSTRASTQFIRQSSTTTSAVSSTQPHPHNHNRQGRAPIPTDYLQVTAPSAEEAVSNILDKYNTSGNTSATRRNKQRYIFNCLVQNEPGVLSRVSGVLAGRGFNIDSLVVAQTGVQDLSRMTIVIMGEPNTIEQAKRQLEDLVPVWAVLDYTGHKLIQRELLLAKVSILGPEHLLAQRDARSRSSNQQPSWKDDEADHHQQQEQQPIMSPSSALRQTHAHLRSLTELADQFQGKVVDVSGECVIVELSAKPDRIDAFIKLIKPFGILELARSGFMATPRSPMLGYDDQYEDEDQPQDAGSGVDASMLPPG
ncbi:hypothetical protein BG011_009098 [Mortierella polycephala]|uniref:ACT domain-containing protein n=1 Tax=Mortierella polycephala TaxID=41804 RepID=A0A9P6TWG1_9FUNG|nr:hypothetical protein BG011_009098 [Mortierella polycephala]